VVDELEVLDRHALVVQAVLGRRLVAVELGLPLLGRRGTLLAGELPVHHREPRLGESGEAAEHDHAEDEESDDGEPSGDLGVAGGLEDEVHGRVEEVGEATLALILLQGRHVAECLVNHSRSNLDISKVLSEA
jgi:hypothetical protein